MSSFTEDKLILVLHNLGIPSHLKGYIYLKEAIIIYEEQCLITKSVYRYLANKYNKSVSSIERAIRNAIEIGCLRSDFIFFEELFGASINADNGKPTNLQFIATVKEQLKII